jgi:putative ABC transport system permease protein
LNSFFASLFLGFRRDLRSKELLSLLVALTLSVSALSSVSFLADRMHRAFEFDARQLLAADLLIASDQPLPADFLQEAQNNQLEVAQTIVFPSMASSGDISKLASIKAVSPSYPLRGTLEATTDQVVSLDQSVSNQGPACGTVFVDPALLNNLHTKIGDSIRLGSQQFVISGILTRELDRGAGFMNFAPRLMMCMNDLASTGLIGLGSRVTYRFLVAGPDKAVSSYQQWAIQYIESQGLRGLRIETIENAQPTMRKTLDRAEQFLSLVSILTAMVAAVAIALSARRYMQKQADTCAALKCFGATRAVILKKQVQTLLTLGLAAMIIGSVIGFLAQLLLTHLLGNLIPGNLPAISAWPFFWSILFTCFLLLAFAGPPIFSLVNVSPILLIRKDFKFNTPSTIWIAILGLACCAILIWIAAQDLKLTLLVLGGFMGAIFIFSVSARFALWLLNRWQTQQFALRFAITAMGRKAGFATLQITALGIALMALLMILLLRQDLLSSWQSTIPPDAPNRFMINIQGDQKTGISQALEKAGVGIPNFYPMVRGRLIEINSRDIAPSNFADENARRLIDREFNLSYTTQLPPGNRIVSGDWIEGNAPQISMESGIAKTLKLKLGDQLTFEVAGEKVTAPITSLRKLDWGSMRVNFFVIMPSSQLAQLPQSWITSYYQNPKKEALDFELSQVYPNLTIVDVSASLQQIQDVIDKLSAALGLLFAFTILAAILVLSSAIAATQDERFKNAALLKALGASRKMLEQIARVELVLVGLLAGLLAGIASGVAVWALGRFVMEIEFHAFGEAILMGVGFGVMASVLAGYRFQRQIQRTTAIECLREA